MMYERLATAALVLAAGVLAMAVLLLYHAERTPPIEESRPYYIYHVVGGLEEDTAHLITREVNTE